MESGYGSWELKWTLDLPADHGRSRLYLLAPVSVKQLSSSLVTAPATWLGGGGGAQGATVARFEMQQQKIRAPEGKVCLHYLQLLKDSSF